MKNAISKYTTLVVILASMSTSAVASLNSLGSLDICFDPYVGADAGLRLLKYERGFGDNLFKKRLPQGTLFGGFKFHEYFGLEGGYKATTTKSKFATINANDFALGNPITFPPNVYLAKSQFKGWYGSLMWYLPIYQYPFDIIGSIGFSKLQSFNYNTLLLNSFSGPIANPTNFLINANTFRAKRTVPTLGIGAQYLHCGVFGLRVKMDWEDTSKFKHLKPVQNPNSALDLVLRQSLNYNVGIFVPF